MTSYLKRVYYSWVRREPARAQCYKTFCDRYLRIYVISVSYKHSSLLRTFVNYGQKSFITLASEWSTGISVLLMLFAFYKNMDEHSSLFFAVSVMVKITALLIFLCNWVFLRTDLSRLTNSLFSGSFFYQSNWQKVHLSTDLFKKTDTGIYTENGGIIKTKWNEEHY